ncbi:hypothetical protein ACFQVC_38710 [Streptomyces monticola]|uniref:Integral membrane protein n=1 Tax=Streptomyces monticola TaxID=2666263 RepID=A0ABW2JVS2_9ACTN
MEAEVGAQAARSRALAVLRVRSRALAVALLPAAVAVVLLAGGVTGRIGGGSWAVVRWVVTGAALLVLLAAAGVALVVARARPALSPTVPIAEESAPDLYRLVRDLADRLEVPAPSAIALTPDCDSWLEDRTHRAHGPPARPSREAPATAPVLVIGSPFLWWMRVGELRAVLAPVVAGTGPSAHPDIAAARRFVRGLDAAVAVAARPGGGPLPRAVLAGVGWVSRLLLRACRGHAAEMERGVAAAAAERAQAVDYGLRIVAQEQVGLAYAGWDRLLTRVALPAWRMGRWPDRLDAGVVAALTELSRRDRLAEGFASRLGERPACDLLEEPGAVDEATSLLAARLFHGGPAEQGPDWSPIGWQEYPEEVVDRKWRADAARLHRVLDDLGVRRASTSAGDPEPPTLARVMEHLTSTGGRMTGDQALGDQAPGGQASAGEWTGGRASGDQTSSGQASGETAPAHPGAPAHEPSPDPEASSRAPAPSPYEDLGPVLAPGTDREADEAAYENSAYEDSVYENSVYENPAPSAIAPAGGEGDALAARLTAELAREEAAAPPPARPSLDPDDALWDDNLLPLFPLQPPRSGRELLTDHVTAMVCCSAVDTAGAAPGLDWLDGPTLLVAGERVMDLTPRVQTLIEDGDPEPLRSWLTDLGVRPEKPVRLV